MAENNEIIKKLLTIATNQQKIITKMAQQMGLANVGTTTVSLTNTLESLLSTMPEASGVVVDSITLSPQDGSVKGKLVMPNSFFGTDKFRGITSKLKSLLVGKNVTADDGNAYNVTQDAVKIEFVGMTA